MIEKKKVLEYLTQKFKGISPNIEGIQNRYDNYVQFNFAQSLIDYTLPYFNKNDKILDVGSGFGSYIYLLKEKSFDACGLEISDFLVDFARQRFQKNFNVSPESSSQIYLKESALKMPFSNNSFDVVTIWNVLEHIQDSKTAVLEAIRVLKPGGKLFIMNVNYAFCFREPHYRVPWVPYLPKSIAKKYLKCLGRSPEYIENGIFYVNNLSILKILYQNDLSISTLTIDKLLGSDPTIISPYKNYVWQMIKFFKLKKLFILFLKAKIHNPLCPYINIIATKK